MHHAHETSREMPVKITWTRHARERQSEWQKKLGITREEIEDLLRNPAQVVPGDIDALNK